MFTERGVVCIVPFLPIAIFHYSKPFNLAALKIGDFACKIILASFIFWQIQAAQFQDMSNVS